MSTCSLFDGARPIVKRAAFSIAGLFLFKHRLDSSLVCAREGYLYLRGSCLRMSSTDEMAYSPVNSVKTMTKLVVFPAPDTAKKNCSNSTTASHQWWATSHHVSVNH